MKSLIILIFALASASAYHLKRPTLQQRSVEMPVQDIEGRITNGNTASDKQFKYQVGLSLQVSAISGTFCGGSLISNSWVLTAAHCTDGVLSAVVYLGATVRTSPEVTFTVQSSDIHVHENWEAKTFNNDITLIRIPAVSYSNGIQPVTLPAKSSSYPSYVGSYGIASGWGKINDNNNQVADHLMWARLQIVDNSVCSGAYGEIYVRDSIVCVATPGGTSTCNGDSGGPLVLDEPNGVQVGLVSYGNTRGCELGYPISFTRVNSYLDWISEKTNNAV